MSGNCSLKDEHDEYVDIHGRDVAVVVYEKTGEQTIPLTELKQTGVAIYQKSQYAKLATIDKQFNEDFHLYMLEGAKTYMLNNKIPFSKEQILKSIDNSKKTLTDNKKSPVKKDFLRNRLVEETDNNEIVIQVSAEPGKKSPISSASPRPHNFINIRSPKSLLLSSPTSHSPKSESQPKRNFENPPQEDENHRKLRRPKSNILEKISLSEHKLAEHNVMVTCIDKRNCVWVRDAANNSIFDTIHRMIGEEIKHQKVAQKPLKFNKVYLAQDEDSWFRCRISRMNPLTVFFLDYGNVSEVDEVRDVSQELARIPCMAVRLTFRESEYNPSLEDELKIKILKQNEDGTYFVNVLENSKPPLPAFTTIPEPLLSLQNDQRVTILREKNGIFFLRTRECFNKLKEIEREIEEYVKSAPTPKNVEINQLVLCRDEDGKFYRGAITAVGKATIKVNFLDYCKGSTVTMNSLRMIDETLSLEPITYIHGRQLKGFSELTEDHKSLIQELIKQRRKFSVILKGDEFDLADGSTTLTQMLLGSKRIRLQDIKTYKPEFVLKTYLCGCFKDSQDISLVVSDELENHIDYILRSEIEDREPYSPVVGEVCLCYCLDSWYRCVITRILNDEFEVLLLDFGNVEVVRRDNLRKPDDQITDIPALALPCRLVDLPQHPNVEDLLKNKIIVGELYKAKITGSTDGKWNAEIPSVYQKISSLL